MPFRESKLFMVGRALRLAVAGLLWVGLMGGRGVAQEVAGADERTPLIVPDDPIGLGEAGNAPAPARPPAPAAATRSPASGSDAALQKAGVESRALLDPTRPQEEVRVAEVPGSGSTADSLLPQQGSGGALRPPADVPGSPAPGIPGQGVPPITASTPFASEQPTGGGPVVMGSDLEPNAAVTPLSPEQTPPEFLDAPVVEATDPWVFSVEVATLYDDNIRLSSRDAQQDFVFVLRASVAWQYGDVERKRQSWARVYYEATGIAFADDSSENSLDHDAQAGGQKRWGSLAAALEGRYRLLSGATPDLGDRVNRDESNLKLSGVYDFSGRTFLEANAGWNRVHYRESGLSSYDEWVAEGFAGYELSGRTRLAAGGAAGQLKVDGAGTQDFQRALLKVTRASRGALGLTGKAGAEFRQTARGDDVTPVFALAADWEPVEDGTRVSGEAFRETVASGALAGENYLRTGAAIRFAQRLGSRFSAGLEAGYEQLDYSDTVAGTASGRVDDYYFARPSLKYEFAARRRAEVFYSFREDDSSVDDFSFTANQWGLSIGLDF